MSVSKTSAQPAKLHVWEKLFYDGDRLLAEVSLFGAALAGCLKTSELALTAFRFSARKLFASAVPQQ